MSTDKDTADAENRRTALQRIAALGGIASGVATAGCLGSDGEEETTTEEPPTTEDPTTNEKPTTTEEDDASEGAAVEVGMVIDLQRCVGCDNCNIACKTENNVEEGKAWAHHETQTTGEFPDVSYEFFPTLCNQCADAPCVEGCPKSGDALYKGPGGITMQNPEECIGCWQCVDQNCPYDRPKANRDEPHSYWQRDEATMKGMASPQELTEQVEGTTLPYYNPSRERAEHESPIRKEGVAEKCTFCYHRVEAGELPACVEECPSNARIFGDLNDPDSTVSQLIDRYDSWQWKEELGTKPKVHYIREFDGSASGEGYEPTKGEVPNLD